MIYRYDYTTLSEKINGKNVKKQILLIFKQNRWRFSNSEAERLNCITSLFAAYLFALTCAAVHDIIFSMNNNTL